MCLKWISTDYHISVSFDLQNLEAQLNELSAAKAALDASVLQCQGDMSALRQELDAARQGHEEAENQFKQEVLDTGLQLLRE